ncbi:hypothetical protein CANINC_001128 [Pichia inconspicua]|uniref:Xylulose kinase n=1 Tax=Pichia inconspicua TaxID=52247 RepID=A0A4T0X4A3_9ASCO|nr:hypothetical protein CANINC_001128 [[Candida] inconspicua]
MLSLGFDLSTQQLKAVAIDDTLHVHSTYTVSLDECSHSCTTNGVCANTTTGEVVTPVAVFIDALQTLLNRMDASNFPFHLVTAIGGSAQQHGTVYYTDKINNLLSSIHPNDNKWSDKLSQAFAFDTATNWQDTSTTNEVIAFDKTLGNADDLANVTGSRAHYRFSGPQMRRRAKLYPDQWNRTCHVSLISTLLQSLLVGKLCPIDQSEACGMNLYDIQRQDWSDPLLALVVSSNSKIDGVDIQIQNNASLKVRNLLGKPENITLPLASYLVKKYKFNENCIVSSITGDNIATLMALPLQKNDVLISMGTSTTVLLLTDKYIPSKEYHLFAIENDKNYKTPKSYMAMICYRNGALARENVALALTDNKTTIDKTTIWSNFTKLLNKPTSPSTVAVFFPRPEIIPDVSPQIRWWNDNIELPSPPPPTLAPRLIVESQALANRIHMAPLLQNGRPNRVFFAGGSTRNKQLVQLYTQILAPSTSAYITAVPDLCALGGALRAYWELIRNENPSYHQWLSNNFDASSLSPLPMETVDPNEYAHKAQLYLNAQSKLYK